MNIIYGIAQFFLNPLLYLFVLLIYLYYRRQMVLERQLFSVRIQSPLAQTIRSIGMGLVGGLIVSVLAGGLGIVVQVPSLWILWILAVCLALIKLRFLCFAYAAGLLTILHGIARVFPEGAGDQGLGMLLSWLRDADPVPILALDALLHLVEAMLVRWNAGRDASPLFIEGRRGRIIGAYQLQSFWLTPLFLLVQTTPESGMTGMLYPGWPLFANDVAAFGIMFLPAVTGFSDITQTMTPWRKARDIAKQLVLYAVILLALAYLSVLWPPLSLAAALFALFGHEGLFWLSRRAERQQTPYFIQSSSGVKIMAVIPGTPAEEMGILPGEIVVKVNGYQVRQKEDLYPALQSNPAFCKMEVLTHDQEIKFVQCAIYAGNHHQLGIIVVPDANTQMFVDIRKSSLAELLKQKLEKIKLGA